MFICRIVLMAPPAGVAFALQVGAGGSIEQAQHSTGSDLQFETVISLRQTAPGAAPDFRGPAVQGRRGQRFIYINSAAFAGQTDKVWGRKLKVPLVGIDAAMVTPPSGGPLPVLETRVPGAARNGLPNCATVKPFAGWTRVLEP